MSRQGRSHRGGGGKNQPTFTGRTHRDRVSRRKEARDRRHKQINYILATAVPHCARSRRGIAVSIREVGNFWGCEFISPDGYCYMRQPKAKVAWTPGSERVPGGLLVGEVTPWDSLDERALGILAGRDNWEAYPHRTALEWLAEQAE